MGKIKIAVTGVGGGVGQSVIKSLYQSEYELVALDGELLGTGLFAVPSAFHIPYARSADFIPRLLEICKKEQISILFPGLDAELKPLSISQDQFKLEGTNVIVSSPEVIDLSNDKLLTWQRLTALGISVPLTVLAEEYKEGMFEFPLIVKQRVDGARSKNVYLVKSKDELNRLISAPTFRPEEYIIQQYIQGDEFTCGSVNLGGECKGVIVMKRILRDGDTYKCFSLRDEHIETEVHKIMNAIKPFGACNVQLRMKDNIPYVFEINARCSGTTAARALCGFNEPRMIADFLTHGTAPEFSVRELSIFRYWQELVVPNESVKSIESKGMVSNPSERHL